MPFKLHNYTSRYVHSMDTQHGDLSVDHVRCDIVQPFTPEKDKPRLVVSNMNMIECLNTLNVWRMYLLYLLLMK